MKPESPANVAATPAGLAVGINSGEVAADTVTIPDHPLTPLPAYFH